MNKDQLIARILQFNPPQDGSLLRQYSTQRLQDYLEYLQKMGASRKMSKQPSPVIT